MKNTTKKIIQASGIAATTTSMAVLTAYATTKYLVGVALNREKPKALKDAEKMISGSQSSDTYLEELGQAAEKLSKRENETIEITSHDGIKLIGHWVPCKSARRIILAMHGWRSTWYSDFGLISDFLEKNDCSVLFAEQRAQNNSGGDYMGFGLIERYDCLDWINWIIEHCNSDLPIYLDGVSMGATTVLMASALDLPKSVHGIVADCGFTSPDDIWKHVANKNLHIPYGIRRGMANNLCKKKIQYGPQDYSTVKALQNTSIPVLFIHGTEDRFVPVDMTYENYKTCISPKKLFVVPGADHCMSYFIDKEGYESAVKEFWRLFD